MIELFTDGSAFNNGGKAPDKPVFGAWACVLLVGGHEAARLLGGGRDMTVNQCELAAVSAGLREAASLGRAGEDVAVVSDSTYVVRGAAKAPSWREAGWHNALGLPVPNSAEWAEFLDAMAEFPRASFRHVRAHTGGHHRDQVMNDLADALAKDHLFELLRGTVVPEDYRPRRTNLEAHLARRAAKSKPPYINDKPSTGRLLFRRSR